MSEIDPELNPDVPEVHLELVSIPIEQPRWRLRGPWPPPPGFKREVRDYDTGMIFMWGEGVDRELAEHADAE